MEDFYIDKATERLDFMFFCLYLHFKYNDVKGITAAVTSIEILTRRARILRLWASL